MLEREDDARKRGARIRAVITGRGEAGDAPPARRLGPRGALARGRARRRRGGARARRGSHRLRRRPRQRHALDERELAAVAEGLGGALPPVSSILGQTGESFSSAMLRLRRRSIALERQALPGTVGLRARGRRLGAELVRRRAARRASSAVLVPSFAQGGANLALVVERG